MYLIYLAPESARVLRLSVMALPKSPAILAAKAALAETLTPFQMTREGPLGKETTALSGIQDEILFADAIAI